MKTNFKKIYFILIILIFNSCLFTTNVNTIKTDTLIVIREDSTFVDSIRIEEDKLTIFNFKTIFNKLKGEESDN